MRPSEDQSPWWAEESLLLVGHGASADAGASAAVLEHAGTLRRLGLFTCVETGFLKGEPTVEDALKELPEGRIVIVPFLMAGGQFANNVIPERLGLTGHITVQGARELYYGGSVGLNLGMDALVLRAIHCADPTGGRALGNTAVLIIAHGSSMDPTSGAAAHALADRLHEQNYFREVHAGFLEGPPSLADWLARSIDPPVTVIGMFAGDGPHAEDDVRRALNDHERGRLYAYTGAIGAEPGMVALILDEARRAGMSLVGKD
jgi:sirohydrochlorin cobaltochelatase